MRALTTDELARMQAAQVSSMMDTCTIGVYTATLDTNGEPIPVYTQSAATVCGVKMNTARENWRKDATVTHIDATIRLPIGTSIKSTDRVTITHRFGVAITSMTFEVVGQIRRGPSGLQVDLLQVAP